MKTKNLVKLKAIKHELNVYIAVNTTTNKVLSDYVIDFVLYGFFCRFKTIGSRNTTNQLIDIEPKTKLDTLMLMYTFWVQKSK